MMEDCPDHRILSVALALKDNRHSGRLCGNQGYEPAHESQIVLSDGAGLQYRQGREF